MICYKRMSQLADCINSSSRRLSILVANSLAICIAASLTGCTLAPDYQSQDPEIVRIIGESEQLFEQSDRCDPFSCTDHFRVISVERLSTPVAFANTGAAGLSVSPFSALSRYSRVGIIESSTRLRSSSTLRKFICSQGDFLILMSRSNWFHMPVESIRLCYHVTSGS